MEQPELVIPNRNHEYVIGIDFGHGETSAALCRLNWDAEESGFAYTDLDLGSNSKVIVSAICRTADGNFFIGEKAFAPNVITNQSALRVCFKAEPQQIDGENEQLMIEYMRMVYHRILQIKADLLTDDNHIVYIARPSGWHAEQSKRLYEQMALEAGIPLAGLTSESRAAFFFAKNDETIGFQKIVDEGAIVVDLGSSTLDLTYLREGESPIDHGYPHGASIVERAIYEDQIISDADIRAFVEKYPRLEAALLYEARKIKEKAYKEPELPIRKRINIEDIYEDDPAFEDASCRVRYAPINGSDDPDLHSINDAVEAKYHYLTQLYDDLVDFRDNYVSGRPVYGVFMTGGASRMGFVADQIRSAFELSASQIKRDDDPSLTISRGIALLGKADAVSNQLTKLLDAHKAEFLEQVRNADFTAVLTDEIVTDVWNFMVDAFNDFRSSSRDLSFNQLLNAINGKINAYTANDLHGRIEACISDLIGQHIEEVQEQASRLIANYSPGRKIEFPVFTYDTSNIEQVGAGLNAQISQSISSVMVTVAASMNNLIGQALWAALGFFLFGLFSVAYYAIKWLISASESEEEKNEKMRNKALDSDTRQKVYNEIANKQDEIREQISDSIYARLSAGNLNVYFTRLSENYVNNYVDKLIHSVTIPIE